MTITARYIARCPACRQLIQAGDMIEWSRGEKARHSTCPVVVAPAPVCEAQPTRAIVRNAPCRRCGSYCYGDCTASNCD